MPSPIPTRILRALALLAGLVVSVETPAATCPQGQRQVCLDSCVCLPDLGTVLGPVIADTRKMAGQALGVWLHLTEQHGHEHIHETMEHAHEHEHDAHHQHEHDAPVPPGTRHTHRHRHAPMTHTHAHFPDAHHRHTH